jgi:hypothetical protein
LLLLFLYNFAYISAAATPSAATLADATTAANSAVAF